MVTIVEYAITGLMTLLVLLIVVLLGVAVVQWFQSTNAKVQDVFEWGLIVLGVVGICVLIGAAVHESTDGILLERLRSE